MKKLYFFVFGFFFLSLAPTLVHAASDNFVPLTSFGPALEFAKSDSLPAFFNALYKICIGVAATLAVLQIMRAGIMYMGGDSVTETKQAREIIQNAVLGLVLVLAPAIIFSIINPDILNLKIGFDKLTPSSVTTSSVESSTNNPTGATNVIPGAGLPCTIPGTTGNTGFTEPGKGCIARAQANVGDVKYTCPKGCSGYLNECEKQGGTPGPIDSSHFPASFVCLKIPPQAAPPTSQVKPSPQAMCASICPSGGKPNGKGGCFCNH